MGDSELTYPERWRHSFPRLAICEFLLRDVSQRLVESRPRAHNRKRTKATEAQDAGRSKHSFLGK